MPLPLLAAGALLRAGVTAATLAPYFKPAIGMAKRFFKQTARPGGGSPVTKGPLMVGKQKVYGSARPGTGAMIGGAAGAAGLGGIGFVASHRSSAKPQTRPQPAPMGPKPATKTEKKQKCCPLGTKRMVCFKRGRVKKKKAKARKARKPKTTKTRKRAKRTRRK
jgi:hypothetical protein